MPPSPGSARVTAGPVEQDFELCTMAYFLRRVPLDELRGRGLMKGMQLDVLEQISSWPSAHAHGDELCTQLIAYTDGSACMTRAWPKLAAEAGWGAVIFAVDASGVRKLAGGVWCQSRRILLLSCSSVLRARPRLPPLRAC